MHFLMMINFKIINFMDIMLFYCVFLPKVFVTFFSRKTSLFTLCNKCFLILFFASRQESFF